MKHLTNTQLQEYADRLLGEDQMREIGDHLKGCKECSSKLTLFRRLETELRKVPLEHVKDDFTPRVMRAIGIGRKRGFAKNLIVNLLPLVGVAAISLILAGVFAKHVSTQSSLMNESQQYVESLETTLGGALSSGVLVLQEWARKFITFSATIPSIRMILGLVLVLVVLALFDEFIFVPIMKRRG